ncbi:MAG: cytochrome c biogenesis protein [Verrucomicrobiota bacterium]|nr:cytochrome c biogenesis protein [Verrucomicrobiota bacterium]
MERLFLIGATFWFLAGFGYTVYALRRRNYQPSRLNFFAMFAGFIFQTAFLAERGHAVGRCPLTNLFEVFIFLCWSMVLFYLLVGPAYRLSLLGAFSSPLVFFLQTVALLAPIDTPVRLRLHPNPWLELHAAISVMAYGAFGLACVAGVMYLAQERQLKTHHLHSIFYHLPPIANLATAINRLILAGFALLTVGLLAGVVVGRPFDWSKVVLSLIVWIVYGLILQAETFRKITPRRMAWLSVAAFSFAVSTLWGIGFITENIP